MLQSRCEAGAPFEADDVADAAKGFHCSTRCGERLTVELHGGPRLVSSKFGMLSKGSAVELDAMVGPVFRHANARTRLTDLRAESGYQGRYKKSLRVFASQPSATAETITYPSERAD